MTQFHNEWIDAFLLYITVFIEHHPNRIKELLKYMHTIRLSAKRWPKGWTLYDLQFRLRKSVSPHSSWAVIDSELWHLYMNDSPHFSHRCQTCKGSHPSSLCYHSFNNTAPHISNVPSRPVRPFSNFRGRNLGGHPRNRFPTPQLFMGIRPYTY